MPENAPDSRHDNITASESSEKYRKKLAKRVEIENMLARHARHRRWWWRRKSANCSQNCRENSVCRSTSLSYHSIVPTAHTHTHVNRNMYSNPHRATEYICMSKIKRKYFMQTEVIIFPRKYSSLQFSISSCFFFPTRSAVLHFVSFWADFAFCSMV